MDAWISVELAAPIGKEGVLLRAITRDRNGASVFAGWCYVRERPDHTEVLIRILQGYRRTKIPAVLEANARWYYPEGKPVVINGKIRGLA